MSRLVFKNKLLSFLVLVAGAASFAACNTLDVYEKNTSIKEYQWQNSFQPGFDFTISDTAALYNIFIVLRHSDAYRYNNIWLSVGTKMPGDSAAKYQRVELELGNDAKGWDGTGMDDIWEVRKPLTNAPKHFFSKQGAYHFTIGQVMRENPLPNVVSVGVRIEKVK